MARILRYPKNRGLRLRCGGPYGLVALIGFCSFMGCQSDRRSGEILEGVVRVEGSPLEEGLITLLPVKETKGNKISTTIRHGNFAFAPEDGVQPGKYRVEVFSLSPGLKALAEGRLPVHDKGTSREIAGEFNVHSQLQVDIVGQTVNRAEFSVRYAPP